MTISDGTKFVALIVGAAVAIGIAKHIGIITKPQAIFLDLAVGFAIGIWSNYQGD